MLATCWRHAGNMSMQRMERMSQQRLVVLIPQKQKEWLQATATEYRTVSQVIRDLIAQAMERESK